MIRWGYAINQFKPQFDDFVRRRNHERALRVVSISGFEGIELASGSGRWEPLGNPAQIAANFGSVAAFGEFVRDAGLSAVSSWSWDPFAPQQEDLTHGSNPADAEARGLLIEHARWYASALAELGGDVLVVRPAPYAGEATLDAAAIEEIAAAWNAVGVAIADVGVRLALHFDFLSALRRDDALELLLAATDPRLVGLALDTAEFAIAGRDPVEFYQAHAERVIHIHLKNATTVDDLDEYLQPAAPFTILRAGGSREIGRWFTELGEPGLVDSVAFVRALVARGYDGWVVVESDLTPHPPTSVMLNGWEVQNLLTPLT